MMLWAIFALLTVASLVLLILPLLRRRADSAARLDYDMQVYRHQLAEIERDQEQGLLQADQAEAARLEIHRRMLAVAADQPAAPRNHRILAATIALALPLVAAGLYHFLGSPALPGQPLSSRAQDPAFKMAGLIDTLSKQLAARPDQEGFRRLGDAQMLLQRYGDAAEAFGRARQMGASDPMLLSAEGEAIVMANGGMVMPEARKLFLQVYAAQPDNPGARFYLGLAQAQIGEYRKAVAIWRDLERSSPSDAPWLASLKQQIADAAQQGSFDPASVAPAPPEPPNDHDTAAAAIRAQAPADQARTIRAMVDGLAEKLRQQPDDFEGWMRLAISYKVLGETAKGEAAARRAAALRPDAVDPLLALAQMQLGDAPETALPADFIATLRQVLAIDQANPTALFYLGLAAAQGGHADEARQLWQKLQGGLKQDQPEWADISKRLASLPAH